MPFASVLAYWQCEWNLRHLHTVSIMSDLQRAWAKAKYSISNDTFDEVDEEHENDVLPELPEPVDDDSSSASSASSVSSTGTIIPSPNQKLFARPQGYFPISTLLK